jgi:hypothetical protein
MLSSTISALEVINGLARSYERPKESLQAISAIAIAIIEGFQGKLTSRAIEGALDALSKDLTTSGGIPTVEIIEHFKENLCRAF